MNPLVSICIPTYNGSNYLKECLDGVLAQTHENIEIIVVDDSSKDSTVSIIEEYMKRDSRISLYRNSVNLGLVGNWNKCLGLVKGEWIKFVFQDDLIEKNCVEIQLKAVGIHSIIACDRDFIFDDSVPEEMKAYYNQKILTLKRLRETRETVFLSDKTIASFAASNLSLNFIGEPTAVMFRSSQVAKVGLFNTDLSQICDLEYCLRIATAEGLVFIPEKLVSFRIHAGSTTSSNVISNKKFKPVYIDPLLMAYELVYSEHFEHFRSLISSGQLKKIKLYLFSKGHEAKQSFEKDSSVDRTYLKELESRYPLLKRYFEPSFLTKLLYRIVLVRRKLKGN